MPPSGLLDTDVSVASVSLELKLVRRLLSVGQQITGEEGTGLYVGVALLAFIIPSPDDIDDKATKDAEEARMIWSNLIAMDGDQMVELRQAVGALLKEQLRRGIMDNNTLAWYVAYSFFLLSLLLESLHLSSAPIMSFVRFREGYLALRSTSYRISFHLALS